jgi:hypothetical protein
LVNGGPKNHGYPAVDPLKPPSASPGTRPAPDRPPLSIVHVASEVVGFAKTGGLADVVGALPRALAQRGHRCAIFLPLYRSVRTGPVPVTPTAHSFTVPIRDRAVPGRIWQSQLADADVPVYLIEQPDYFERDDPERGWGFYQYTTTAGQKQDYPDNCERFAFYCRAVLEALPRLNLWPDVLHIHDWQTGLVPTAPCARCSPFTTSPIKGCSGSTICRSSAWTGGSSITSSWNSMATLIF